MSGREEEGNWTELATSSISEPMTGCVIIEFQYQKKSELVKH